MVLRLSYSAPALWLPSLGMNFILMFICKEDMLGRYKSCTRNTALLCESIRKSCISAMLASMTRYTLAIERRINGTGVPKCLGEYGLIRSSRSPLTYFLGQPLLLLGKHTKQIRHSISLTQLFKDYRPRYASVETFGSKPFLLKAVSQLSRRWYKA